MEEKEVGFREKREARTWGKWRNVKTKIGKMSKRNGKMSERNGEMSEVIGKMLK